jgi:type-IV secretion system protein TraC
MSLDFFDNIYKGLDKVAKYCGLDEAQKMGCQFFDPEKEIIKEIGDPASLVPYLGYRTFDEDTNIFTLDDGFCGFLIEIVPIVGVNENVEQNLEYFFADELPDNTYFQVIMLASNDVSRVISSWQDVRSNRSYLLDKFASRRSEFLTNKASGFDAGSIIPRNYRLFICVSRQSSDIKELTDIQNQLVKKLKVLELLPEVLDAKELINLTQEIGVLNLGPAEIKRYNKYELLSTQAIEINSDFLIKQDQITNGDIATRVYKVADYPEHFSLRDMINLLGDGQRDTLTIPGRFAISFTVATNINKADQASIVSKGRATISSAEQFYSRHNIGLQREAGEWLKIIDQLENSQRLVTTSMQVLLSAPVCRIDEAQSCLISLYNIKKFRLKIAHSLQLVGLLSVLPFGSARYFDLLQKYKLTSVRTSAEVVHLLPMHGEWKGVPKPGMLLIGKCGQVFHWNPFYRISSGNYNVVIFGPSGGGKSVFLQEMVQNMIAQNTKVFILDIGQSFKNLCLALGGDLIQFSKNMDISLNPFSKLNNSESLDDKESRNEILLGAINVICSMAGVTGDALKTSLIEQAIVRCIKEKQTSISAIAQKLKEIGSKEALEISHTLYPYTSEGRYGKYFDRESNIFFDKKITVFEFEEIKADTGLLAVVLQIISMQIFLQVLCGDRDENFVLIVDEAWMILDYAAKFLSDFARTIRKYGGSLVTCVQSYDDFQKTPDHQAVFANSTWTVMLKQDEKTLASFKSSEAFSSMLPLIRSISFKPGRFSECLIYTTGVQIVGRLALDKYASTMYSTDSNDFNFLKGKTAQGMSIDQAVEELIAYKSQ